MSGLWLRTWTTPRSRTGLLVRRSWCGWAPNRDGAAHRQIAREIGQAHSTVHDDVDRLRRWPQVTLCGSPWPLSAPERVEIVGVWSGAGRCARWRLVRVARSATTGREALQGRRSANPTAAAVGRTPPPSLRINEAIPDLKPGHSFRGGPVDGVRPRRLSLTRAFRTYPTRSNLFGFTRAKRPAVVNVSSLWRRGRASGPGHIREATTHHEQGCAR